jgi:succinate dehydrogenase/fumarate reductase flavoprotein subunit
VTNKRGYRVYATDVLVIGVEAAGGFAAIKASEDEGVDVIAITKGSDIGRAGATVTADSSSFAIECQGLHDLLGAASDTRDSPEVFFEDVVREGKYVNDQTLVESLGSTPLPATPTSERSILYAQRRPVQVSRCAG